VRLRRYSDGDLGFALLGEVDGEYRGAALRCNHWVLALRGADQASTGGRRA
jgi:hypothetical protein